ncbi:hypothetical protein LTR56_019721 [Elasticomyces elasticus]|nr:hypothetical protein LTR56_019721 [Elasticomyces elasticus]KAK3655594.1 hypothetical protein LTR22_010184 [Elasticomyces elasticus]KAK4925871.1 hypothetical protein LTR49_007248 [Elasticomyces elasticus]KAK5764826.1 hypothetical protein LTS12_005096 [Elasticomyces elasticus]
MAAPPFTKMPTEMVCEITSFLDLEDLVNFRLVSRWAERESFRDVAARGLKYVCIEGVSGKVMPSRLKAVEGSPQFASAIKYIRVYFPDKAIRNWASDLVKGSNSTLFGDETLAGHDKEPTLSYVISHLPKFDSLSIEYLNKQILTLHILPSLGPAKAMSQTAWTQLRELEIDRGELRSTQWLSLMRLLGPKLTVLSLERAVCRKGMWLPVLQVIQETFPVLSNLTLDCLSQRQREPWSSKVYSCAPLYFLDDDESDHARTELEECSECVSRYMHTAFMRGQQAVQVGLDKIVRIVEPECKVPGDRLYNP